MPSPTRILEYFADLAPAGRGPRWNHTPAEGDLVSIPWPWKVASDQEGALIIETRSAELEPLWNLARLHGSRGFLRLGWIFISGSCDIGGKSTKVFVPIASVPVRVRWGPGNRKQDFYQVVADADLAVPESLFSDHTIREHFNERLEELVQRELIPGRSAGDWPELEPFVNDFCDAVGLPRITNLISPSSPVTPLEREPAIHTGLAVYASVDRSAVNLQSTLLAWIRARPNATALAALYSDDPDATIPDLTGAVANSLPLNATQERAILMARDRPISVLSGPPGTGKTHTAVAMAIDQVAHGNSVLIATQSDDAIDAVESMLARYSSPRHVRFGSRTSRRRVSSELSEGLQADTTTTASGTAVELEAIEADLVRHEQVVRRRLQTEEAFSRSLEVRSRNSWCLAEAPRLNRVLEAPRLMAAVQTALNRRSTGGLLRSLRRAWADRRLGSLLGVEATRVEQIAEPVQQLIDAERAVRAGQATAAPSIAAAFDAMEEASARARVSFGKHLEALRSGRSWSPGASRSVALLATALRSGQAARRRALQDLQIDAGLEALPLWIGTLADIDDVLPMRPGMFDVVIIDESSQVNQIRAATSLARGRRAVVIGDPRQLRHVSFVSDEAMEVAAAETGVESSYPLIDVRRNSLFDVAAGRTPVLQLTEHYRSAPHLIEFSGRHFYGDRLQMMTAHPTTSRRDVIDVVQVAGRRDAAGVVHAELEYVIEALERAANDDLQSVGVVTPFRAQADAFERRVLSRFSARQIDRLDLRVGTVHGFQGNERDHVFISLALDPSDKAPLRFIEDPNLFNVMVTRARSGLTLVLSIDARDLPDGLLASYVRYAATRPAGPASQPSPAGTWSAAVASALRPYRVPMWENYPVGGYTVDIAIGEGSDAIGVECAVHPDGVDAHMARHSALRRAGWELMTAMESRYLARPGDAAEAIIRRVVQRDGRAIPQSLPKEPGGQ